ncbi:anaerobic ribonucleoside-triphosphate reductase activating protein [Candidatus Sumerlaeota bacterium]|nr:anaerobic ribonucleoside-triphosphate reductase activating protein [Candidatus Sumerlaeota bacterium]
MRAVDELRVGGFTPLTTIDYPGELAAVIFCQGCPWRCRYCHNEDLLPREGQSSHSWEKIVSILQQRQGLLDAVVFSGGEPTLQPALIPAMSLMRDMGYKIGLHTSGAFPDRLATALKLADWVGLDVKALPEDYPAITGSAASGAAAWESAALVIGSGVSCQFRVTVHPQLTSDEQFEQIQTRLREMGAQCIVKQPCQTQHCLDPALRGITTPMQS